MQPFSIQRQPTAARSSTTLSFTELLKTAQAWHGDLVGSDFDELDDEHEISRAPGGGHTHLEIDLPALLPLAQRSLHHPWAAYPASHTR